MTDIEVHNNTLASSDTFAATFPLSAMPAGFGWSFWAQSQNISAECVIMGVSKIIADVDTIALSADKTTAHVTGRDASKKAMETKGTKSYKNKTASGIVNEIAASHGYDVDIDATTGKAGKIHDLDFAKLTDQHSDWTVLQHLADREGKVCYFTGNKLSFKTLDDDNDGDFPVAYVPPGIGPAYSNNVVTLHFTRNLEAGKPTDVNVHSHHTKTKMTSHGKASVSGGGSSRRVYEDRVPGLKSKDQGDKIAKKRVRQHTRHEITVKYDGPGDATVTPRMRLVVSGTGTALDQPYYMDTVSHHVSHSGYVMNICAKNTMKGRS